MKYDRPAIIPGLEPASFLDKVDEVIRNPPPSVLSKPAPIIVGAVAGLAQSDATSVHGSRLDIPTVTVSFLAIISADDSAAIPTSSAEHPLFDALLQTTQGPRKWPPDWRAWSALALLPFCPSEKAAATRGVEADV